MLTVGSLFAGIGGFDEGFRRAGARTLWQIELNDACRRVLARRFPEAEHSPDVGRVHGLQLADRGRHAAGLLSGANGRPARRPSARSADGITRGTASDLLPDVDVVCGGFPCQDLSVAGKRAGLAGERSGLWFQFHRLLAELAPRWVVIENVPGLLSSNGGRDMAVILRGLAELGYGWAYRVLDAQYFGVAQRRRRVFIVGCLGDGAAAAQVLFEPESCDGDTPPSRAPREGLAGTLGGGSGERGWAPDTDRMTFVPDIVPQALRSNPYGDHESAEGHLVAHTLKAEGYDASEDGTGRGVPLIPFVRATRPHGAHYGPLDDERWEEADISPSLAPHSATQNAAVASTMAVRRLTPTECERLQGFPDGWTEGESDSARYRMLGNAVAVPVVEWIARRIVHVNG